MSHSPVSIPRIVYGTAWKKEKTAPLVVQAVMKGFKAVDTAAQLKHYNEAGVGEALKELSEQHQIPREDLFIQTKYTPRGGQDLSRFVPYDLKAKVQDQVRSSVQNSLKNLGTSYIDSVLLHSPLQTMSDTESALVALQELTNAGKIRFFGISNIYEIDELRALHQAVPGLSIIQNRWHIGNGWDRQIAEYCRANQLVYQSFWTLTGSPQLVNSPTLGRLMKKKELKTASQALFGFAQAQGITPLCGTTSEEHMVECLEVDGSSWSEDDCREVKEIIWG